MKDGTIETLIAAVLLLAALPVAAATPLQGNAVLRDLAVPPTVNFTHGFVSKWRDGHQVFTETNDASSEIRSLQSALRNKPGDVRMKIELAELLNDTDQTNAAHLAWLDIEKACRQHLESNPDDGRVLLQLGEAVRSVGAYDEAESVYRRAVLVSSNDWLCWAGLGSLLECKSLELLVPQQLSGTVQPSFAKPPRELLDFHPQPEALQRSEALHREAGQCMDRVTNLAPKEPDGWVEHGMYTFTSNWVSLLIGHFKGDVPALDASRLAAAYLSQSGLDDLRRAEDLAKTNYTLVGATCFFAMMQQHGREPDATPESLQPSVRKELLLLEDLGRQPDKKAAAGALAALAWMQMSLMDVDVARASAREAVANDPTSDSAWDILILTSVDKSSPDEIVELCQSRLKQLDSPRSRLFLAKAFLHQEKPEKAVEQAKAILKIEPDNLAACLVLAAADLKRTDNPQFLDEAGVAIHNAMNLFQAVPPSAQSDDRHREISLNLAIWSWLQGDAEHRKLGKATVQNVLENLPDDQTAKDILKAME